jgi:Holliday junction resolvase RusA-like endonuclease
MQYHFVVPMRCATKERPRDKTFHMPEAYMQWKQDFAVQCMAQGPVHPLEGELEMTVWAFFKGKRRKDVDNTAGAVMDALNGIAYADDDQVYDLHSHKRFGQPADSITVDINPATM